MPSWLWAWLSSIALGTWRSKTFSDLKHDVLVLFYYIIIIDVEMNGVLLGTIFSASLIFFKKHEVHFGRCASGVCNVIMCVLVSKGHKDRSCACSFMSPLRRKKKKQINANKIN